MENIENDIEKMAGIKYKDLFDKGLINRGLARNWIVRTKYYEMAKTGRKYADIKQELSDKYEISVSSIENLIYKK